MIAHLTTVHPRTDIRIRVKETSSLIRVLDTFLEFFVQDGQGDELQENPSLQITDTGAPSKSRLMRATKGAWRMYRCVLRAKPQIAHFHDPELITVAFALKLSGIKIIYDVHEDLPRQILGKYWVPVWARKPIAYLAEALEWIAGHVFDGIVAATPTIANRFPNDKTVTVQNFPILSELLAPNPIPYKNRPPHFVYIGGITPERGAEQMITAISQIQTEGARLQLAGIFNPKKTEHIARTLKGWDRVDFYGWANRENIADLLGRVRAGLVVFHSAPNHTNAQPNKLFEYMAASLPVIASDFALWREIVDRVGCGLLVDPLDDEAIATAMQWLLDHPEVAEAIGRRGRRAIETTYNWETELDKLCTLYRELI